MAAQCLYVFIAGALMGRVTAIKMKNYRQRVEFGMEVETTAGHVQSVLSGLAIGAAIGFTWPIFAVTYAVYKLGEERGRPCGDKP